METQEVDQCRVRGSIVEVEVWVGGVCVCVCDVRVWGVCDGVNAMANGVPCITLGTTHII